jgi:hypothetical protein
MLQFLPSINQTAFPLISKYLNVILNVAQIEFRAKQINPNASILSVI